MSEPDYDYRCLICDHIWESDEPGESCPKCGEFNDVFQEQKK